MPKKSDWIKWKGKYEIQGKTELMRFSKRERSFKNKRQCTNQGMDVVEGRIDCKERTVIRGVVNGWSSSAQ